MLVVDDDKEVRQAISRLFTRVGFEITEAENGEEALNCLSVRSFDLVITDLNMPGKNGIEFLCGLRARDSRTTIIVLTAYGEELSPHRCWQLNVSQVLEKPVTRERLLSSVWSVLGKPEQGPMSQGGQHVGISEG